MRRGAIPTVGIAVVLLVVWYWPDEPGPADEAAADGAPGASPAPARHAAETGGAAAPAERGDWFPDLSRPPPVDSAAASAGSAKFDCDVRDFEVLAAQDDEARLTAMIATLSGSADHEMRFAAHLLQSALDLSSDGNGPDFARLSEVYFADSANPLMAWHVAATCFEQSDAAFCADPIVQQNLEAVLGSNSWYWIQVAQRHSRREDPAAALLALQQAVSAPAFDDFYFEMIDLMTRAYSAAGDTILLEGVAIGHIFTRLFRGGRPLSHCAFPTPEDPAWQDVCITLAERLLGEASSLRDQIRGADMLAQLYEKTGQAELAQTATQWRDDLRALDRWYDDEDAVVAMLGDERVLQQFLEQLAVSNEASARLAVIDSVATLKQDPDYDPCRAIPPSTD